MKQKFLSALIMAAWLLSWWQSPAALAAYTKPVITTPLSGSNVGQTISFSVSVPSGSYDQVTLFVHPGSTVAASVYQANMNCSADSQQTGFDVCNLNFVWQNLNYATNYFFVARGIAPGVSMPSEAVVLSKPWPNPAPEIISPASGSSYNQDSAIVSSEVAIRDASGIGYPAWLTLSDASGKTWRRDSVSYDSSGQAKMNLIFQLENQYTKLAPGTYFLEVWSYKTVQDRNADRNRVQSNKVRVEFTNDRVGIVFKAPANGSVVPACKIGLRVGPDNNTVSQQAKFSRFELLTSANIAPLQSNRNYRLAAGSDNHGLLSWDLSNFKPGNKIALTAKGFYERGGRADAGLTQTASLNFTVAANTGSSCGVAHRKVYLSTPAASDWCLGSEAIGLQGQNDRWLWRPGDQPWSWSCQSVCLDSSAAQEACNSLAPIVELKLANGNLIAVSNVPASVVNRLELWLLGSTNDHLSGGAVKVGSFRPDQSGSVNTWVLSQFDKQRVKAPVRLAAVLSSRFKLGKNEIQVISQPLELVNDLATAAVCGETAGKYISAKPTDKLCAAGDLPPVYGNGPWTWTCPGKNGSGSTQCRAYVRTAKSVDGICGSAHGQTLGSRPTQDLCASGTASGVSGNGPWTWTCRGYQGNRVECRAEKSGLVDGVCGSAHNRFFVTKPSYNLCKDNSTPTVYGNGPWTWTCKGQGGGKDAKCLAAKLPNVKLNGICGSAHGKTFKTKPSYNLCTIGSVGPVEGDGPWTWSCAGINGGAAASCSAQKEQTEAQPLCGSAHGQKLGAAPTSNLCASGSASAVEGNGPWTWSCSNKAGAKVNCRADKQSEVVNGSCGSAHGQSFVSTPTDNLCASGQASPVYGNGPWTWVCRGINGGSSADCSAQLKVEARVTLSSLDGQEIDLAVKNTVRLQVDGNQVYNLVYLRDDSQLLLASKLPGTVNFLGRNPGTTTWRFDWNIAGLEPGEYRLRAVAAMNYGQPVQQSPEIIIKLVRGTPANNQKNPSRYSDRQVFLVSDNNWVNILPLIPLTVWTEANGSVSRYPLLVYKNDNGKLDIDSTVRFLQQYQAKKASLAFHSQAEAERLADYLVASPPLGAGLADDGQSLEVFDAAQYLSHWSGYSSVVYVENDYEKALVAANYASLLNAPLIIRGSALDKPENLSGRQLICVGSLTANCYVRYNNTNELRQAWLDKAKQLTGKTPNKIVLVNAKDWNYSLRSNRPDNPWEGFKTERSGDYVNNFFGKHSLAGAYLAAAKQQLLLTATDEIGSSKSDSWDSKLKNGAPRSNPGSNCSDSGNRFRCNYWRDQIKLWVEKLGLSTKKHPNSQFQQGEYDVYDGYLTVVADPQSVPYRQKDDDYSWFDSADKTIFANIKVSSNYLMEDMPDLMYGRIYGFTVSDVSSYVNRAVFYDRIAARRSVALFASAANWMYVGTTFVRNTCQAFKNSGYTARDCITRDDLDDYSSKYSPSNYFQLASAEAQSWINNDLVYYHDHGGPDFAGIWSNFIPDLSNTFVATLACSTAEASINVNYVLNFSLMAMRKGAIAYLGAPDLSYETNFDKDMLNKVYYQKNISIGQAFFESYKEDAQDTLIGDPTLKLVPEQNGASGLNQPIW